MKTSYILFMLTFFTCLTGCSALKQDTFLPQAIYIKQHQLIYQGDLTPKRVNRAIALAKGHTIHEVMIESLGGEVMSSIKFGRWIFQHHLNVKVVNYCTSSCANYIFPAGNHKYLAKNDILGWHGGAYQRTNADDNPHQHLPKFINKWRKAETAFYHEIGVNPNLPTLGQQRQFSCQRGGDQGWYYSINDLNRLGIHHIILTDGQWHPLIFIGISSCKLTIPNKQAIWKQIQAGHLPIKTELTVKELHKRTEISKYIYFNYW
ncbi:MAG: hypothetical protein CENE_01564 [Candidatus Celerinatantimonas neptuna]|nr:MAG: hypothetical protein CENE_01564 [Candidatus Celerinatantimonas neptuna]